ncbi:MAG: hypothetical protein JST70_04140 [Bacteroidetes bacterium]|nr:hypothetical protein [Bacteroidota bacterium]
MTRYILILLVLFPEILFAQRHVSTGNEYWMYKETDCQSHILRTIIEHGGTLNDSCPALMDKGAKDLYILQEPYFRHMPDTFMGVNIHYINADSNTRYWYERQKTEHIPIYYMSPVFSYLRFYYIWLIPVNMKKKKVEFANRGYIAHYEFRYYQNDFQYQRSECQEWQ